MPRDINQVMLTGRLTRDPDLRQTSGGTEVLGFGLAVSDSRKRNGEWEEYAHFVDVTVFGKQGRALSGMLAKGSKVAICGKLQYSTWERDGQKRSKLEVIANDVILPPKPKDAPLNPATYDEDGVSFEPVYEDKDIPF